MSETCQSCTYWVTPGNSAEDGRCKRYAPAPHAQTVILVWPVTQPDDWCGEFQPAPGDVAVLRKTEAIWSVLVGCADARRKITYGILGDAVQHPGGRGRGLGPYLDRIADYCATEDLPDLTILVVLARNGKPSTGNTHADVEDEQERVFNQIMWPQHPRFAP